MLKSSAWFHLVCTLICIGQAGVFAASAPGGPDSNSDGRYKALQGTRGMVVSDDQLASEWGAEVLRRGGNAVDAAVATAFMLSVTRPHSASLGGGGFFLYCPKPSGPNSSPGSSCQSIDYREVAPSGSTETMYIQNGKANAKLSQSGALATGVPGVPAGLLMALEKYGTFSRQKVLKKPIEVAKNGFDFTFHGEQKAIERWEFMNESAKKVFGCGSTACPVGTRIKQKDLARVLEEISKNGAKGFYEGHVGRKLSQGIRNAGGILSEADLRNYRPQLRTPVTGKFKNMDVISMAPPSSGGAIVLQLLALAQLADRDQQLKNGYGDPGTIHALAHGMATTFADRSLYFGDPDFVKVPLNTLLSTEYLAKSWGLFKPGHATHLERPRDIPDFNPQHTTHFSVMDKDGNAVAITTTINDDYGSCFIPPGTGVVMNNQMDDFSAQPGVPNTFGLVGNVANSIRPGKRPLSSMSPTIVKDSQGNNIIVIGAAGGPRIITSVFQSLLNHLHFGMSLADAVTAPRFHFQWKPNTLSIEKFGFPKQTRESLEKMGYSLSEVDRLGIVHALERNPRTGRSIGVPDPRGEGAAEAE